MSVQQIYQSRKIILELMEKQGLDVSGYANFSMSEINAMQQNNQLDMLLGDSKKVYIRYYLAKTIRPGNVHEMIEDLFEITETLKRSDTLYIIIKSHVNDTMLAELKDIWERDGIFVIIENIKCLQFNILNHVLVPEHTIMDEETVEQLMTKYNITDRLKLPRISRFDPVARAIGIRPGQVCKIMRPSKTAVKTPYYRLCIN